MTGRRVGPFDRSSSRNTIDLINGDPPPKTEFQDSELLAFVSKIDKLDFRMRDALKEMMLALLARHERDKKGAGRKERVA